MMTEIYTIVFLYDDKTTIDEVIEINDESGFHILKQYIKDFEEDDEVLRTSLYKLVKKIPMSQYNYSMKFYCWEEVQIDKIGNNETTDDT